MAKKPAKPAAPAYPVNPALEAAVIANAEDDTPRLVYADWLDENGDPDRAAFIRNQVALWDKNPADEDYVALIESHEQLDWFNVAARLEPEFPSEVGFFHSRGDPDDGGFQRGFPFFAHEPHPADGDLLDREYAKRFRDALPTLFRTTTLRGFHFYGWFSRHLDLILDSPEVAKLVALHADNGESEFEPPVPVVESILDSPASSSIGWLDLGYLKRSDADLLTRPTCRLRLRRYSGHLAYFSATRLKKLLTSDSFRGLHHLQTNLSEENASGALQAIARLPDLHTFKSYGFGPSEVAALPRAGRFTSLARLVLHGAPLRGTGADALAKAKMPRLAVLELAGCKLRNQDFVTLARSPVFTNLRSLLVADPIGDQAVVALAESGCAGELKRLDLQGSTLGKKGLLRLATAFPALTALGLHGAKGSIPPDDVSRFFAELSSPLRTLAVPLPISDQAAFSLAANHALSQLISLNLGDARAGSFTVKGLTALLTSPHLSNLTTLVARGEKLEKALPVLCDPSVLPRLRELQVGVSWKVGEKIEQHRSGLSVR